MRKCNPTIGMNLKAPLTITKGPMGTCTRNAKGRGVPCTDNAKGELMIIGTYNPMTGDHVTINVPVTEEDILQWQMGTPASVVFNHLQQSEIDIILTGMDAGDWDDWEKKGKAAAATSHTQAA